MATSRNAMGDWDLVVHEDSSVGTPRRRSRRGGDSKLSVKNRESGVEIKVGDVVHVDDKAEGGQILVITEIIMGTKDYIEILGAPLVRLSTIPTDVFAEAASADSREVAVFPTRTPMWLSTFVGMKRMFATLKEAELDDDLVCTRVFDLESTTEPIDWTKYSELLKESAAKFYNELRDALNAEKKKRAAEAEAEVKTLRQEVSEMEVDESESGSEPEDGTSSDGEFEDSVENKRSPKKNNFRKGRTTVMKAKRTPTRRNAKRSVSQESESESEGESPKPRSKKRTRDAEYYKDRDAKKKMSNILQKSLKFREESAIPELPQQPRLFDVPGTDEPEVKLTTTVKEFTKTRKLLHTGAKVNALPCREEEFATIYTTLDDAIQTSTGCCLYISGTPGTGKTATVREVVKHLQEDLKFDFTEINGLKLMSPAATYELLWQKINGRKVSADNAAMLLEHYFDKGEAERPLVVLMDELDQVFTKNQQVMYNFFNWPSYPNSRLIVIAIANTMDLPERLLSNKISSRLGLTRVQFRGYSFKELAEIIRHRLNEKNRSDSDKMTMSKDAIDLAARKVASVSGDARRALMICMRACEIAEAEFNKLNEKAQKAQHGKYTVSMSHIIQAASGSTSSPATSYLQSLTFLGKLFLYSLLMKKRRTETNENSTGEVIDEMENLLKVQPMKSVRGLLEGEKVDYEKLFNVSGSNLRIEGFQYVVRDLVDNGIVVQQNIKGERMRTIRLNLGEDEIIQVLKRDDSFKDLFGET